MADRDREECVQNAKIAEQTEGYEDMLNIMLELAIAVEGDLTEEERNLLSVAYNNVVGGRLASVNQKEESRLRFERESHLCVTILRLLNTKLIQSAANSEKVFFMKMRADIQGFEVMFKTGSDRNIVVENTLSAYLEAQLTAIEKLESTDPLRLQLAIDFSVSYHKLSNELDSTEKQQSFKPLEILCLDVKNFSLLEPTADEVVGLRVQTDSSLQVEHLKWIQPTVRLLEDSIPSSGMKVKNEEAATSVPDEQVHKVILKKEGGVLESVSRIVTVLGVVIGAGALVYAAYKVGSGVQGWAQKGYAIQFKVEKLSIYDSVWGSK